MKFLKVIYVIINYDIPHVFVQDANNSEGTLINYNCVFKPEFIDYSLIHTNDFKGLASSLLFNTFFIENKPVVSLKLSGLFRQKLRNSLEKCNRSFSQCVMDMSIYYAPV